MQKQRRGLRALGATLLFAATAGCTHRTYGPVEEPLPAPTPPRSHVFVSLADAEPALTALEDRRAFDSAALEAGAQSADPAVRARTALALGRIGDERAAAPLRSLLSDRSPEVRESAAFSSGILAEATLTAALAPALADSEPRVAERAAWAIGLLEAPDGQDALIGAIAAAPTADRRSACLRALWRFATPAAAAEARPYAADSDPSIRSAALYALARRPQETSLDVLTAALADTDADTAALCARGLGILGRKESVDPLAAALDDPRPPVRIVAAMALETVIENNPGSGVPVERQGRVIALSTDANPNVAVPALRLLRWLVADREVFRRLVALASGGQMRRQQVALQALMAGLGEKSESLADAAIASPDPFLRAAAAQALSFLPEADAAPRRAKLAADPEVVVRVNVLEGLRTLELVRANRALVDSLLEDPDAGVRAGAIDALALLGDPATLSVFRDAILKSHGDAAPDVPIEAIAAAQKQAAQPEALAAVEAAYRHPSTLVSRLARRALVGTFHADPAAFPWREYATGKSVGEYAVLLAEARRPWTASVETDRGTFRIRLDGEAAPLTVVNFARLAQRKYFDGVVIHRVVPGFVVQDGDPTGTGNGGPGYEIRDEINTIRYWTGTVGMALSGPDTGGSQWFVTQAPQPHLDGTYTVFGRVDAGMDVLGRIEQGDRIRRVTVSAEGP